jgi:hypothetical protein
MSEMQTIENQRKHPRRTGSGRKKGTKNQRTRWKDAQINVARDASAAVIADPIEVVERVMMYFYTLGVEGAKHRAPFEEVQKCFNRALHAASIAAPYRHPRLSAVKHVDAAQALEGIRADATPEELRAEITKRIRLLKAKGYLDLEAIDASPEATEARTGDLGDAGGEEPQEG